MTQNNEENIKLLIEKEYIILRSISRYGYAAIPQNYDFLTKYSMLNIYLEIVKSSTAGLNIANWEKALKQHAADLVSTRSLSFGALRTYKSSHGAKDTKILLDNNDCYWKTLLNELKRNRYEYAHSDKKDTPAP